MSRGGSSSDPELESVLNDLADGDCRELIQAMDVPRGAADLAEESDVPVSTTYRKLERLDSSTLVEERIEIREDGRHTSLYTPAFEHVIVSLNEELEFELEIVRPQRRPEERLEELWSAMREEV